MKLKEAATYTVLPPFVPHFFNFQELNLNLVLVFGRGGFDYSLLRFVSWTSEQSLMRNFAFTYILKYKYKGKEWSEREFVYLRYIYEFVIPNPF